MVCLLSWTGLPHVQAAESLSLSMNIIYVFGLSHLTFPAISVLFPFIFLFSLWLEMKPPRATPLGPFLSFFVLLFSSLSLFRLVTRRPYLSVFWRICLTGRDG